MTGLGCKYGLWHLNMLLCKQINIKRCSNVSSIICWPGSSSKCLSNITRIMFSISWNKKNKKQANKKSPCLSLWSMQHIHCGCSNKSLFIHGGIHSQLFKLQKHTSYLFLCVNSRVMAVKVLDTSENGQHYLKHTTGTAERLYSSLTPSSPLNGLNPCNGGVHFMIYFLIRRLLLKD